MIPDSFHCDKKCITSFRYNSQFSGLEAIYNCNSDTSDNLLSVTNNI